MFPLIVVITYLLSNYLKLFQKAWVKAREKQFLVGFIFYRGEQRPPFAKMGAHCSGQLLEEPT